MALPDVFDQYVAYQLINCDLIVAERFNAIIPMAMLHKNARGVGHHFVCDSQTPYVEAEAPPVES
jgi:hypothetical protein